MNADTEYYSSIRTQFSRAWMRQNPEQFVEDVLKFFDQHPAHTWTRGVSQPTAGTVAFHADRPTPLTANGFTNTLALRAAIHRSRENSTNLLGGGSVTVMDSTLVDRIQAVLFEANMIQQAAANNAPLDEIKQRLAALDLAARI